MTGRGALFDDRRAQAALLLAVTVPLWVTAIPPLLDLPGHLGRYRIMTAGPLPSLAGYDFHWQLIGNLGVDLLMVALAPLLGVERAAWLITLGTQLLMAAALLRLSRQVQGRVMPGALFALALLYSYPFQLGLTNFWLGAALALLALALWLRMAAGWRRDLLFAGIAAALWLVHVAAWGAFGLMAFGSVLGGAGRPWGRALATAVRASLPLAVPLLLVAAQAGAGVGPTRGWLDAPQKLVFVLSLFRDRWLVADQLSVIALLLLLLLMLVAAAVPARVWPGRQPVLWLAPELACPALLLLLAFAGLPVLLLGSYYADVRLLPLALMLALLAFGVRPGPLHTGLMLAGLLFLALRLALTTASFARYDAGWRRELAALAALPRGASVLVLTGVPCWEDWHRPRLDHLGSLATVRRDAFTNDQFIGPGAQTLRVVKPGIAPFIATPSQSVLPPACRGPGATDADAALAGFNRAAFDHVWLINLAGMPVPADLAPLWSNGQSALYRVRTTDSRTRPAAAAAAAQRPTG